MSTRAGIQYLRVITPSAVKAAHYLKCRTVQMAAAPGAWRNEYHHHISDKVGKASPDVNDQSTTPVGYYLTLYHVKDKLV